MINTGNGRRRVADGAIIGLAATELDTPKVGNVTPNTTLTADGDDLPAQRHQILQHGHAVFRLCPGPHRRSAGVDAAAVLIPVNRDGIELVDDCRTASGSG